ncbi:MAG: hypothetical protein VX465_04915, partial [Pseudomonadota bacterium]|nr:hypothetical protein [Pseudomonadota bacterium]
MDAATTSLAPANSTRGEWARFGAFLKRPTLPARAPLPRLASLVAILRLMLLDFAMMGVLLGTAAAVMATGVSLPQTALAGMEIGAEIVFAVVVIAPLACAAAAVTASAAPTPSGSVTSVESPGWRTSPLGAT